jgi:membrane protein
LLLAGTTIYFTIASVLRSWQSTISDWLPMVARGSDWLAGWLGSLLPVLISVVLFILIYRTMPRNRVTWRDVWLGGLLAGLIWEGARRVFAWYLGNFANYSLIYGSLGAVIGFLLWAYLSAMIVLLGAEFTAQYSAWRRAGRPIESRPPRQWFAEWSKWNNL